MIEDFENIPPKTPEVIKRENETLEWIHNEKLHIDSVDNDVLGGSAIYLHNFGYRTVWIALMNNNQDTVTFYEDNTSSTFPWDNNTKNKIINFLRSK